MIREQALMHLETLCVNGLFPSVLPFVDFHALESVSLGANAIQKAHITISSPGSWFLRRRLSEAGRSQPGKRVWTDLSPFCRQTWLRMEVYSVDCDSLPSLTFSPMSFRKCSSLVISGRMWRAHMRARERQLEVRHGGAKLLRHDEDG